MFENLTGALQGVFRNLRGRGKLSQGNIKDALGQVRKALLKADVNFAVAKAFVKNVEEKAIGQDIVRSISPGQQVIKLVHDELVALMGSKADRARSRWRSARSHDACRPPGKRKDDGLRKAGSHAEEAGAAIRI